MKGLWKFVTKLALWTVVLGIAHYFVSFGMPMLQPVFNSVGIPEEIPQVILGITGTANRVLTTVVDVAISLFTDPNKAQAMASAAENASRTTPRIAILVLIITVTGVVIYAAISLVTKPGWVGEKGSDIVKGIFSKKALPFWGGLIVIGLGVTYVRSVGGLETALREGIIPLLFLGVLALALARRDWFKSQFFNPILSLAEGLVFLAYIAFGLVVPLSASGIVTSGQQLGVGGILLRIANVAVGLGRGQDPLLVIFIYVVGAVVLLVVISDKEEEEE